MAFRWCENMGGFASDTCTSWTPTGVNSSQTVPFANVVSGETPVATVRSTMLPITWQITPHCKLVLEVDNNGQMYYTFYDENNNIIFQYYDYIGSDYYRYKIGFAVDDTLQQGLFVLGQYRAGPTDVTWYSRPVTVQSAEDLYPYLIEGEQPPVTYQWSSVPAISGKNGILSLSTLNDINDGDPIETTDATKFTLTSASNVKTLVDAVPLGSIPASGGGAAGSNPQYGGQAITGKSGTQSTGYAFGQGAAPGGGGGLYGGYGAEEGVSPAGAGSGYIGNTLLTNKKMYGYGVAKNTSESTYTISKSNHSIAAIEKKPKAGNGYARITYLRPLEDS